MDDTIDGLRLGDNVVWHADSVDDYRSVFQPFVTQARRDGRRLVYLRFGLREPLLSERDGVEVHLIDPGLGFERFALAVRQLLTEIGPLGFYLFDPLSDLHQRWHSDLMVLNFFKVTCPSLFELDTVAYFALLRNHHTYPTVAGIRETTQLLLDLHRIESELYVQPLKVWQRHSPTMFFPHLLTGGEAISITSSLATTTLFASLARRLDPPDPWQRLVNEAWSALTAGQFAQAAARDRLLDLLAGTSGRMARLCRQRLLLTDLLAVASRLVGTGRIGGKSVGMLLARAILEHEPEGRFAGRLEPHDSFFLGSDVFVSFLVANGWWTLWTAHEQPESGPEAAELHRLIPTGSFPRSFAEDFLQLLEHFGQAPIIVRSSSLLEDDYGNAFAGKYASVFLANQGTPEERLAAFEDAVRTVYASAVGPEALQYRRERGLMELDEQMSILVQRVSGDLHQGLFFPMAAGVANSSNPYVWDASVPDRGLARLVAGLGTRAVDRTGADYARIVSLADPASSPIAPDDLARYSQRRVDAIDLAAGGPVTLPVDATRVRSPELDWSALASPDLAGARRLRELGRPGEPPDLIDCQGLLARTDLAGMLSDLVATLADAYDHPVDVEFTVNLDRFGGPQVNLVQCRPLQARGAGGSAEIPAMDPDRCLLASVGAFMGGNARMAIDWVVLVRPEVYLTLGEPERHAVARRIGDLNQELGRDCALLIGPGRWGTSMPSLGVPTHFREMSRFAALLETTYADGEFRPELSYGSHFFLELVERGIFYAAVLEERTGVWYRPALVTALPDASADLGVEPMAAVWVARTPGLVLHADVVSQRLLLQWED